MTEWFGVGTLAALALLALAVLLGIGVKALVVFLAARNIFRRR